MRLICISLLFSLSLPLFSTGGLRASRWPEVGGNFTNADNSDNGIPQIVISESKANALVLGFLASSLTFASGLFIRLNYPSDEWQLAGQRLTFLSYLGYITTTLVLPFAIE